MLTPDLQQPGPALSSRQSRESSVRGQVYRLLLRDIVQCRAEPGQTLSEKEVAATLGVSRTPVREAFLQLAEDGLLVISPQRGTAVTRISTRQVRQAQFIREVLERAVLAVGCRTSTGEACGGLDAALYAQRQAATRMDYAAFYDADELFHAELARLSGFDGAGRGGRGGRAPQPGALAQPARAAWHRGRPRAARGDSVRGQGGRCGAGRSGAHRTPAHRARLPARDPRPVPRLLRPGRGRSAPAAGYRGTDDRLAGRPGPGER